ncbi:MAG: helix-turn-helix domain-containing protein [Candidatus Omnitrophica bacterium]|nr:helix-turn-helix domain-containing protein [Candidatus Omnitrophota bacterium]
MSEKLLNTKEVSQYLGISEEDLRKLVDRGEIPAYRLGGTILRFRKDQIDGIKVQGIPKVIKLEEEVQGSPATSRLERLKDFFYFHDFYIISAIIVAILLVVIFLT